MLSSYTGHSDNIFALDWSPDGRTIASGSRDNTVQIWRPETGELLFLFRDHQHCVLALDWSPDGHYLASSDTSGVILIWEAKSGKIVSRYQEHARFVRSVAWSPDGRFIASGGDFGDSTAQVWEALSARQVSLHSAQYRIFSVLWSPKDERIASASFDASVQIWQAFSDKILLTYRRHRGPVYTAVWSPDGTAV
ncbi:MAG TPA: WD40 repeat domain-containing protein, partial [Ktedonobacteraceae bacterium]